MGEPKVILAIIGARTMHDRRLFDSEMSRWIAQYGIPDEIVSGGAIGADTFGERYAGATGIPITIFKPEYDKYPSRVAPIMRNTQIIDRCTHVLAFPSQKGIGTQNSIKQANGKPVQCTFID